MNYFISCNDLLYFSVVMAAIEKYCVSIYLDYEELQTTAPSTYLESIHDSMQTKRFQSCYHELHEQGQDYSKAVYSTNGSGCWHMKQTNSEIPSYLPHKMH